MPRRAAFEVFPHVSHTTCGGSPCHSSRRTKSPSCQNDRAGVPGDLKDSGIGGIAEPEIANRHSGDTERLLKPSRQRRR